MNITPSLLTHIHTFAQLDLLQISHTNMIMTESYKPLLLSVPALPLGELGGCLGRWAKAGAKKG